MTSNSIFASFSVLSVIAFACLLFVRRRADRRRKADYEQIRNWLAGYQNDIEAKDVQRVRDAFEASRMPFSRSPYNDSTELDVDVRKHDVLRLDVMDMWVKGSENEIKSTQDFGVSSLETEYLKILESTIDINSSPNRYEQGSSAKSTNEDWLKSSYGLKPVC